MNVIDAILELELFGYIFVLEDSGIRFLNRGDKPEAAQIRPLLETIKENKSEATRFLAGRNKEIDLVSYLLAQAEKAEDEGDFDRSFRLHEAAAFERSKSYAKNEDDRYRCPKCPFLGQGSLYELGGTQVLCDTPCPKSASEQLPLFG